MVWSILRFFFFGCYVVACLFIYVQRFDRYCVTDWLAPLASIGVTSSEALKFERSQQH
jgi:hypothetical protein